MTHTEKNNDRLRIGMGKFQDKKSVYNSTEHTEKEV
jgi:hypothetical protein